MKISEIFETVRIAMDSMKANKLRSFLASLGVVIGISFVILMGWVLAGLDKAMQDSFDLLGVDMLYVDKWDWSGGRNWEKIQQRKEINLEQAEELCESLQSAELAVPTARKWSATFKYRNDTYQGMSIIGTYNIYSNTPAGEVVVGRFFSPFEDKYGENVIVIGYKIYSDIFNEIDPSGKIIKIGGHKFTIIGVIKKQGTMFFDFIDYQCFIPLKTFLETFGKSRRSFSVAVKAGSIENLDEVRAETQGIMRSIRNLQPGEEDDFSINETKAFESSIATFRLYVWGIGIGMTILSFIVGIIGIMNIMFVSVAERTKEIGIRKAIGAKKSSILVQFIIEAATLCFVGAIMAFVGCSFLIFIVGTFVTKAVPELGFLSPYMPFELLLIATIVSVFVGILAGLIPAYRASALDPIESLRYE